MRPCSLALCVAIWCLPQPLLAEDAPGPRDLTSKEAARLADGEYLITVQREGPSNRGELVAILDAKPLDVWAVLVDFPGYEEWFPNQRHAVVVSTEGRHSVLEGEVDVPIFPNWHYRMRDLQRVEQLDGRTVFIHEWYYLEGSGNLKNASGFWCVSPYGDGSRSTVRLVMQADFGVWLPDEFVHWGTDHLLARLPRLIEKRVARVNR